MRRLAIIKEQDATLESRAPNVSEPLEIVFEMEGRGLKPPKAWFSHPSIVENAKSTAFKMQRDRWPYFFAESLFD
jgi:hypothetical protein